MTPHPAFAGNAGIIFLRYKSHEPYWKTWEYQTTSAFDAKHASDLLTTLPENTEICFFDPSRPNDEAYIFARRNGHQFFIKTAGHGWSSDWNAKSIDWLILSLLECPLVKRVFRDFASFSITENAA